MVMIFPTSVLARPKFERMGFWFLEKKFMELETVNLVWNHENSNKNGQFQEFLLSTYSNL